MKIKKLCALVLAAVASVTAFSGCGGGGDNSSSDGYISAKKFANGSITIQTWGSVTGLEIMPDGNKLPGGTGSTIVIPNADPDEDEDVREVEQTVRVGGSIGVIGGSSYNAYFTYSVLDGGETGHLTFTLDTLSGAEDEQFINALGVPTAGDDLDDIVGYERAYLNKISDLSVDMLFTFAERKLNVILSGNGFVVKYTVTDADGVEQEGEGVSPYPITIMQTNRYYTVMPR